MISLSRLESDINISPTPPGDLNSMLGRGVKKPGVSRILCLLAFFTLLAVSVQYQSGSYGSELSHWPDAPGHVTNSIMIHDYVKAWKWQSPMGFAEQFYGYYPKVSIGMWPPLYYSLAALWMMLVGVNKVALLVFVAFTAGGMATMVAWLVWRLWRQEAGILAGILWVFLPQVLFGETVFLLDIAVSLVQFVAMLALLLFLERRTIRSAVWFGLWAAIAMLTKGNAMALANFTVILVVITRSWWTLRHPGLYAAAVIVACVAGPWQWVSLGVSSRSGLLEKVNFDSVSVLALGYGEVLVREMGWPLLLMGVSGIVWVLWRLWTKREVDPKLTGTVALMLGSFSFHCMVPLTIPDERYMMTVYSCLVILVAVGVRQWGDWLPSRWGSTDLRALIVATVVVGMFSVQTFRFPRHLAQGFEPVAAMFEREAWAKDRILICSDSNGEGGFIVAIEIADRRPQHMVLRTSKFLSENSWSGQKPKALLTDTLAVRNFLDSYQVDAVVVDNTSPMSQQDRQLLLKTISENGGQWETIVDGRAIGTQRNLTVFHRRQWKKKDGGSLRVPLTHTLRRDLMIN